MRLTVRHIENAVSIDEQAVRPRERTLQRIWLRTIASAASAERGCDDAGIECDIANDVVLGVGHKEPAVPVCKSLGSCQLGEVGRPAVARIAFLAGTSQMMKRPSLRGDTVDRIALAKREIKIAFMIEHHCSRPVQRRLFHRRTVRRRLSFAGAAIGLDHAARKIHLTNPMVPDVANEQLAAGIDRNAVRLAQLGLVRRPAIP